jgi:hypothetical protein
MRPLRCLLVLTVLAGCGGSDPKSGSDREQVEQTIKGYMNGLADGDGEQACGHLTESAQGNIATAGGANSCQEAVDGLKDALPDDDRQKLRAVRVTEARIDGSTAEARISTGSETPPDPVPLEKTGDGWKIAGFPSGVQFGSQAEAQCISGGISEFDDGGSARFWRREGREDFRDYLVELCRRADRRGVLEGNVDMREFRRIAGEVILEMQHRGQIAQPQD